jgi:hypothetical protein
VPLPVVVPSQGDGGTNALVTVSLPVAVPGGTGNAWATHDQRKRVVGWILGAGSWSMVAAIDT